MSDSYVPEQEQSSDMLLKRAAAWDREAAASQRQGRSASRVESCRREAERLFALALERA